MEIFWSAALKLSKRTEHTFQQYCQRMANRIMQGHARYGEPKQGLQWIERAELELKAYKRTGNAEHLFNLSNYGFLEYLAPEHPKFHEDGSVGSVTRGAKGIKNVKKSSTI